MMLRVLLFSSCLASALAGCATPTVKVEAAAPALPETRTLDPQIVKPSEPVPDAPNAVALRLFDTSARDHVRRSVLYRSAAGEIREDETWRWSSLPDRYIDTALRFEVDRNPKVVNVDASSAPTLELSLVACHLVEPVDGATQTQLVVAVQSRVTTASGRVVSDALRLEAPVELPLPGDLQGQIAELMRQVAEASVTSALKVITDEHSETTDAKN